MYVIGLFNIRLEKGQYFRWPFQKKGISEISCYAILKKPREGNLKGLDIRNLNDRRSR